MYYNIKYRLLISCIFYFGSGIFIDGAQCLSNKFKLPDRFNNSFKDAPFEALNAAYSPVNLYPGTPNFAPPLFLRNLLSKAARSMNVSFHQYADPDGMSQLKQEIALLYSELMNRKLNASENVIVTVGTTEALHLTLQAYTLPGDEWILIEPALDIFPSIIRSAQGTVKPVQLRPNTLGQTSSRDWTFDRKEMTEAFNNKTKGIVLVNPNNPTGKIYTEEELRFIADLANKWDVLVVIDEVYEALIFDSNQMTRAASLSDEIFNRSVTANSVSKAYAATGWRLGWAIAPADVINNLKMLQYYIILSYSSPTQIATAEALKTRRLDLGKPDSYISQFIKVSEMKRNKMIDTLMKLGLSPVFPEGGYFIFFNYTTLESKATGLEEETDEFRDQRFVRWLAKTVGVLMHPGSLFFSADGKLGQDYLRICFQMTDETLDKASQLLLDWFL